MEAEVLATESGFERISMPDADVLFLPNLDLGPRSTQLLQRLIAEVPWRAEEIVIYGRKVLQPRLTAWYGDAGKSYAYSGIELRPLPWTPLLLDIKGCVETAAGSAFNSVLLNYYRDQQDSIGFHSDDEPELGTKPVIASLSLGAERVLVFKHKKLKHAEPVRLHLPSGSLLLMRGETQHNWRHGVPKERRPRGARINLTFRTILDRAGTVERRG